MSCENALQSSQDFFHLIASDDRVLQYSYNASDVIWDSEEWEKHRNKRTDPFGTEIEGNHETIIKEILDLKNKISVMVEKLPAEAIAFYRPFHYIPFEEWGIYFILPKYNKYLESISRSLQKSYAMFHPGVVATLVLFEMFHHEFYHHLVESTAFTLETILSEIGSPKPVYLDYFRNRFGSRNEVYCRHIPLEEALANAYAHNSISFAQRTKMHFDKGVMGAYQKVLKQHWKLEPPGYQDAEHYINERTVYGNTLLLKIMLQSDPQSNVQAMEKIVSRVMPSGYTSMVSKPEIPTYFLGNDQDFSEFTQHIPNPKAAYAKLEFPFFTTTISEKIKQEKERRKSVKLKQGKNQTKQMWLPYL